MASRYLLDEHFRGDLWVAIIDHNRHSSDSIDVVRVSDHVDLPLATVDSDIPEWAERSGRVLISRDRRTMIAELAARLRTGRGSPGLFIVRRRARLADVPAWSHRDWLNDRCQAGRTWQKPLAVLT